MVGGERERDRDRDRRMNVHMKKAEKDARPPAPSGFTFDLGSH